MSLNVSEVLVQQAEVGMVEESAFVENQTPELKDC